MKSSIEITGFLSKIVSNSRLHARWLNTLSYLENCGARMISSCEHPTRVKEEMLKHAAEEFRHAYHLKRQIRKASDDPIPDYTEASLLGGAQSKFYLSRLNGSICRYLKNELHFTEESVKEHAYLMVTYAIEVRASQLYPLYQQVLNSTGSNISMRAIIAEEETHLNDIDEELQQFPNHELLKHKSLIIENELFISLFKKLSDEIKEG